MKPIPPQLSEHARAIDARLGWRAFIPQLAAAAALLQAERAAAQSISPDPSGSGVIADAVNWLTGTLLGNVATGIAILAVAIIAILLMTGRIEWGRAALVVIGIFASLGRADAIVDRMSFLAGYNVRLLLVVQGLAQLDQLYGGAGRELILQNAGLQLFFAPNDETTAGYVSARLGMRTVRVATRARSTPAWGGRAGSVTRGTSLLSRPLLSADEVRRLNPGTAVLFVEGARPVHASRIVYHADPRFAARLRPPVQIAPIGIAAHPPFRFDAAASPATEPVAVAAAPEHRDAAVRPRTAPRGARARDAFAQLDFDRLVDMPPGEVP